MATVAAIGWALFVVMAGFAWLDRGYYSNLVEQKDNCIALWRGENGRVRGKLADSEQIVELLQSEVKRLTPKHGQGGKFISKSVNL
jgi:hypothetical protein